MRCVTTILVGSFALAFTLSVACAEPKKEPTNKEKIVGTWAITRGDPPGSLFEYTKEGKLKMTIYQVNLTHVYEGTYEVDGDTLKHIVNGPEGKALSHTWKIKTLTDKTLITEYKLRTGEIATEEFQRQ